MYNITTNVPELDEENVALFKASQLLEKIGNFPNPSANEFYAQLAISGLDPEDHEVVTMAAISIETMMNLDLMDEEWGEPTVH